MYSSLRLPLLAVLLLHLGGPPAVSAGALWWQNAGYTDCDEVYLSASDTQALDESTDSEGFHTSATDALAQSLWSECALTYLNVASDDTGFYMKSPVLTSLHNPAYRLGRDVIFVGTGLTADADSAWPLCRDLLDRYPDTIWKCVALNRPAGGGSGLPNYAQINDLNFGDDVDAWSSSNDTVEAWRNLFEDLTERFPGDGDNVYVGWSTGGIAFLGLAQWLREYEQTSVREATGISRVFLYEPVPPYEAVQYWETIDSFSGTLRALLQLVFPYLHLDYAPEIGMVVDTQSNQDFVNTWCQSTFGDPTDIPPASADGLLTAARQVEGLNVTGDVLGLTTYTRLWIDDGADPAFTPLLPTSCSDPECLASFTAVHATYSDYFTQNDVAGTTIHATGTGCQFGQQGGAVACFEVGAASHCSFMSIPLRNTERYYAAQPSDAPRDTRLDPPLDHTFAKRSFQSELEPNGSCSSANTYEGHPRATGALDPWTTDIDVLTVAVPAGKTLTVSTTVDASVTYNVLGYQLFQTEAFGSVVPRLSVMSSDCKTTLRADSANDPPPTSFDPYADEDQFRTETIPYTLTKSVTWSNSSGVQTYVKVWVETDTADRYTIWDVENPTYSLTFQLG